jgi:hypothetical protein
MAARSRFETVILIVLIAAAVIFVLLLAGIGSEFLTNPKV